MAGPARIGQLRAREPIQGLIHRLGLGEAGRGVVEVDHGSKVRMADDKGRMSEGR